jgi:hypothetical protein
MTAKRTAYQMKRDIEANLAVIKGVSAQLTYLDKVAARLSIGLTDAKAEALHFVNGLRGLKRELVALLAEQGNRIEPEDRYLYDDETLKAHDAEQAAIQAAHGKGI